MAPRPYGQYCGMSRALELIGERWALIVIRDLLVGPKRFSDIERGLPGIPSNVLTARLKEFEAGGIVRRRALPRPPGGVIYELTDEGRELEETVLAIGRWGAKRLGDPRPDEVVTDDSIAMALRASFRPQAASGLDAAYLLRLGEIAVSAIVRDGALRVERGAIERPDLVIETGPALRPIMAREITPAQAIDRQLARIEGDPALFERFAEMFRI